MVAPLYSNRTQRRINSAFRRLDWTFYLNYADEYDCWRVNRGPGWADSTAVEATERIGHGMGDLIPQGPGGPQASEMVISLESPYRFNTLAFDPETNDPVRIESGHLLAIRGHADNGQSETGQRLFRVDLVKRGRDTDLLMDVYLTELFSTPMPGVA